MNVIVFFSYAFYIKVYVFLVLFNLKTIQFISVVYFIFWLIVGLNESPWLYSQFIFVTALVEILSYVFEIHVYVSNHQYSRLVLIISITTIKFTSIIDTCVLIFFC
jgi:hypothetical protein